MDGAQLALLIGMLLLVTAVVVLLLVVLRRVSARRTEEASRQADEIRARAHDEARGILSDARAHAREIGADADRRIAKQLAGLEEARDSLAEHRREVRDELTRLRGEQREREERLAGREARLDRDHTALTERAEQLQAERAELDVRADELEHRSTELTAADADRMNELERIASLTADQARRELLDKVEHEARMQSALLARDIETAARRTAEQQARLILVGVMERLASEQTTETTVSSVDLPSEDMKGRIIGREGRNIRSFEQITGTNLVIDDSPDTVLVSCFDPVRREIARIALAELLADGRIHPTSIEETHQRATELVAERCHQAADDALLEVGITDMAPELVDTLGKLRYRTSYGQNVLAHLVECAHLARMIAAELGLDPAVAARAAFLHDIGKALTHEAEGSHAIVGAELARRHGEHADVVHAIEAHHNEVEPNTVEAHLVQVVDKISGARPGARRESVESFMKRMTQLEKLARGHAGVDKVFAMQAGRDVRVMVKPEKVDDLEAQLLARTIAKQFEEELTYPGQIKVTVVRESRATETAR